MFCAVALLGTSTYACKSKAELEREYQTCKKACISKYLPGGSGGESIETALRRSSGGGPCLTKCNQIRQPKSFMKRIERLLK